MVLLIIQIVKVIFPPTACVVTLAALAIVTVPSTGVLHVARGTTVAVGVFVGVFVGLFVGGLGGVLVGVFVGIAVGGIAVGGIAVGGIAVVGVGGCIGVLVAGGGATTV